MEVRWSRPEAHYPTMRRFCGGAQGGDPRFKTVAWGAELGPEPGSNPVSDYKLSHEQRERAEAPASAP